MKYIIIILLLCSCTVTHRLERKQYNANVHHIAKEIKQEQKEEEPKVLELKSDSGQLFIVPAKLLDSFMQMRITIGDVVVKAKSKTLSERNGNHFLSQSNYLFTFRNEKRGQREFY